MNIDLSKDKNKIIQDIDLFLSTDFFTNLPFLKDSSTVLISGSVATNIYDKNSDIDLHIIRSEELEKDFLVKMKSFKQKLINSGSNIELRFSRTYEILEEHLNFNDDYILGEFQNSEILYDAKNRFKNILKNFDWYPKEIYNDKSKWLLSEIFTITEREIGNAIKRGNLYYLEVLKTKYLRNLLTLVRILNKKYPIYDKRLFETTYPLVESAELRDTITILLNTKNYKEIFDLMINTNKTILQQVQKTLNENINHEELMLFSTKNKISFE